MVLPFPVSVAVLAALLFFPVSKLIWVMSVRRLERKLSRPLTEGEREGQLTRARFVGIIVAVAFSWLFNLQLAGLAGGVPGG